MAKKYRLSEGQLQRIFEHLLMNEGELHPDDPTAVAYDQEAHLSEPTKVEGSFSLVAFDGQEYLMRFNESPELFYTIGDSFNGDIYSVMEPFLSIHQTKDSNEDGEYWSSSNDWQDHVTDAELAQAVVNYMNDQYENQHHLKYTTDVRAWESNPEGQYEFLLISPEMAQSGEYDDAVLSDTLKAKIAGFFQQVGQP